MLWATRRYFSTHHSLRLKSKIKLTTLSFWSLFETWFKSDIKLDATDNTETNKTSSYDNSLSARLWKWTRKHFDRLLSRHKTEISRGRNLMLLKRWSKRTSSWSFLKDLLESGCLSKSAWSLLIGMRRKMRNLISNPSSNRMMNNLNVAVGRWMNRKW